MNLVPYFGIDNIRAMIFVDGENLSIRFGAALKTNKFIPHPDVVHRPDVYVWNRHLSGRVVVGGGIIRSHYYTAVQGDHPTVEEVTFDLRAAGIAAPRVFKKVRGMRSKRVDITLATEMLMHAARRHFDIGILVTGDEDYVPLIEAVKAEGLGVHVWSLPDGLSPQLVHAADLHVDLGPYLLSAAP
jgi:hypothetical protein